nr:MAG TPA: hypothetical protein [Bacteriophage sp.]
MMALISSWRVIFCASPWWLLSLRILYNCLVFDAREDAIKNFDG